MAYGHIALQETCWKWTDRLFEWLFFSLLTSTSAWKKVVGHKSFKPRNMSFCKNLLYSEYDCTIRGNHSSDQPVISCVVLLRPVSRNTRPLQALDIAVCEWKCSLLHLPIICAVAVEHKNNDDMRYTTTSLVMAPLQQKKCANGFRNLWHSYVHGMNR